MTTMLAAGIVEEALSSMQFLVFLALAVGGMLFLGASAMFGGHHETDLEHDFDHGAGDGDHSGAPSFLSPRIFVAFLTGFGVAGAIATAYGASPGIATAIGFVPGLIMSAIAWFVAYFLLKQQANSNIRPGQVIGASGTVVSNIPDGGIGEANILINGQVVPYTAMSDFGQGQIGVGSRIRVVSDLGDKVVVKKETV